MQVHKYFHHFSRGVVHRDIKLENLLVDGNRLKLSDFGFSRQLQGENDISQTYCGSRLYSSPQILQGKPYRPQLADVWSLGVVTFAVVTGALPFCHVESSGNTALIEAQLRKHYHLPAEVSCEFRALIEWLLTFEEAQRPSMEVKAGDNTCQPCLIIFHTGFSANLSVRLD